MHPLRIGLKVSQIATIDELEAVWKIADDAGFDHCWNMDHVASLRDDHRSDIFEAWTELAGMAARTTRTRIGCAVTGNTYRHPAMLAKMAVTVDHLSRGRLEFGIGAGWAENEHTMLNLPFGTAGDRATRLEEAVPIIKSLWTQPSTTFEGKHYQLVDAISEPKPMQRPYPPIWVGGTGRRRTLRVVAEHADVWNAPGGTPEEIAELNGVLEAHCADVGRDSAEIRRSVQIHVARDGDRLEELITGYLAVGVTEIILTMARSPVGPAEQLAERLPALRALDER